METRRFEEKGHVHLYVQYRPTYPDNLFKHIVDFCSVHDTAVDVACGSGQSTLPLTNYFRRVIGSDVSAEQIASAKTSESENLSFRIGVAENLDFLENESVDLVTVASALHWIDRDAFFREATRVLKPGGVLAVYGYWVPQFENENAQKVLAEYYEFLREYWHTGLINRDTNFVLPFPGWTRQDGDDIAIKRTMPVGDFIGYLTTTSSWRSHLKDHPGSDYLDRMKHKLIEITSTHSEDTNPYINVIWAVYLLMGRKPK